MKKIKYIFVILLVIGFFNILFAESKNVDSVMVVTGIRSPFYNEFGELSAELIGGRAFMIDDKNAIVEHLRIDLYEKQKITTQIYLPKCKTTTFSINGRNTFKLDSNDSVIIENNEMTITGDGFKFNPEENFFEIKNNASVFLKNDIWSNIR